MNASKFKVLENAHNTVVDKLNHIDLDLAGCMAKVTKNIEANESSLASIETQLRLLKASDSDCKNKINDLQSKLTRVEKDVIGNNLLPLNNITNSKRQLNL